MAKHGRQCESGSGSGEWPGLCGQQSAIADLWTDRSGCEEDDKEEKVVVSSSRRAHAEFALQKFSGMQAEFGGIGFARLQEGVG